MNKFFFNDTSIIIDLENTASEEASSLDKKIRRLIKRNGFTFHMDPMIVKKFPSLKKMHYCGDCKKLEFIYEINIGEGLRNRIVIEFFQNINFENPHGGRYDFSKYHKMPYLMKQAFKNIRNKIAKLLSANNLFDSTKYKVEYAVDDIMINKRELQDFQRRTLTVPESKDGDGNPIVEGDLRYFYYNGILHRGIIYHHINNMWYVVVDKYKYYNIADFQLFTWKSGMPIRNKNKEIVLKKLLAQAINHHNYEKAIIFRDLLGIEKDVA